MNHSSQKVQLQAIDKAMLALFQERVRLCRGAGAAPAATEDMLRRAASDVDAESVRAFFELLEGACGGGSTK